MENLLESMVEEIGLLSDNVESSRWCLCERIELAFSELPAYTKGLTEALSIRLRKSSDSIYDMRDSWRLFERLKKHGCITETPRLSSSHYSALYELAERYEIPTDEIWEWLVLAEEESMSTRALREEISTKFRESERKGILRAAHKIERLSRRIYEDSEALKMPEDLREATRTYLACQGDWLGVLMEWLG